MRENTLRTLLDAGRQTLSTRIHSTWPNVIEAVGHTGVFDYVEFAAEYAPFTLHDLENLCRAAELYDMSTMIKVDREPNRFLAQRAVGAGFQSVLFADCETPEDVRACVRTVRPATPDDGGDFGVGTRRHTYMEYGGTPAYVQALRDIVVVIMIEKRSAVENLAAILSVEGVDMIQWGPADYSLNMGRPGQWHSDQIKAVERRVIEICRTHGVPARAEINSVDEAEYYRDLGVQHFSLGTDLTILYRWLKENGEMLRDEVFSNESSRSRAVDS